MSDNWIPLLQKHGDKVMMELLDVPLNQRWRIAVFFFKVGWHILTLGSSRMIFKYVDTMSPDRKADD